MISVIYSAEPKIFSNLNVTQQKTLIRLFDMSMQSGEIENLYAVLEGVMDMSSEDRADLAGLLKYTNLSNITKTIAIIKDRLEVIQKLKYLVLDEERYSTEIDITNLSLRKTIGYLANNIIWLLLKSRTLKKL